MSQEIELEDMRLADGRVICVTKKFKPTDLVTRIYRDPVGMASYRFVTREAQEWALLDRERAEEERRTFRLMLPYLLVFTLCVTSWVVALYAGWLPR